MSSGEAILIAILEKPFLGIDFGCMDISPKYQFIIFNLFQYQDIIPVTHERER